MKLEAKVNFDRFEGALQVVDSHTVGEFCRIVIGGFPEPEGNTMIEKKKWMEENYDHVRTALMFEPRGHHDMFGAFLCEPVNPEAQFGVMFMDTGGYLNMCGHCTIGAVTVAVEAGLVESKEGENEVILDAPAGLIRTKAVVKNGKVENVTLTNVPSFVYKENQKVTIDGKEIDLSYKEFELLTYFVENRGIALSREKILNNVWDYDYFGDARTIDTHVKKLRSKMEDKGELIKTIWGMGYKFDTE